MPALLIFVAASAALTYTRPAIYLPLFAAGGALLRASAPAEKRAALTALITVLCVAASFAALTYWTHGAGAASELRWSYNWQTTVHGPFAGHGFAHWWLFAFLRATLEAVADIYRTLGPFGIFLACAGVYVYRRSLMAPAAVGAVIGAFTGLLGNPFDFAVERTVTLPCIPVAIAFATFAVAFPQRNAAGRTTPVLPDACAPKTFTLKSPYGV